MAVASDKKKKNLKPIRLLVSNDTSTLYKVKDGLL
jgi:hypothetical protein